MNAAVLAVLAPPLTGTITLFAGANLFALSVDLVTKTRQLLREGYTHDDVRTASLLERRLRERELQSVLGDAAARARRRRTVIRAAGVAGLAFVALVGVMALHRLVPTVPHLLVAVPAWAAVITLTAGLILAVTYSAQVQRSNLLYYGGVWRRWFGRWLFALAALGLRRPRLPA